MRRLLAAVALTVGLTGYLIPQVPAAPAHHAPAHCQTEYGHSTGQPNHWERICQP